MYNYFSIEGFRIFGIFYLCIGLPAFLYFYADRKKEKTLKIWFLKVLAVGVATAAALYTMGYYFDGKDYKKEVQYCENKDYVLIDRNCYKSIGDNHYIKADTVIVTLKKE